VHTVLDMLTLIATGAVIYALRFKLVDTYQDDQDSVKTYYVVRKSSRIVVVRLERYREGHRVDKRKVLKSGPPNLCPDLLAACMQVIPCVALAALAHPGTNHPLPFRVRIAACNGNMPCLQLDCHGIVTGQKASACANHESCALSLDTL